jgi:hypothetical protein
MFLYLKDMPGNHRMVPDGTKPVEEAPELELLVMVVISTCTVVWSPFLFFFSFLFFFFLFF